MALTKPCIVLIGTQHVGKTTLGKGLAEKLGVPFYDTDQMVTKTFQKHICVFAQEQGQEGYNWAETEMSKRLVRQYKNAKPISAVISTGSGFWADNTGIEELRKIGTLYWIDANIELGAQRLMEEATTDPEKANPYLLKNGKYYNVYFSTPKIKRLEDIKKRHLKRASAASKYFEEIADETFRPKDAPAEENIQLLYDSIFKENIEGKKAV